MATQIMTPAGQLLSKNERAWWDAAAQADGPYSPRPGRTSEIFCGGSLALQRIHAVDISSLQPTEEGQVFQAPDASGRTWHCRWLGGVLWSAFRDRTDDEVMALINRCESRSVNMLPAYALRMCKRISVELYRMSYAMRPEMPMPRSQRRAMKHRLADIGSLLEGLLYRDALTLGQAESRMLELGIRWEAMDPCAWLDANP